jgi:two-component system sensor histidine kinase BaeS
MRLRLFLSFALVALVSVAGVAVIARQNAATAVRAFMYRGGMVGEGGLIQALETYYQENGSWDGVESLLLAPGGGQGLGRRGFGWGSNPMSGMGGMMSQRLRLANAQSRIVADTTMSAPTGTFSRTERNNAIKITVNGQTVGYLLAEGGMGFTQGDETFLVDRLSRAALTAGLIAGGLSLLLSLLLAYSLMRPVRDLTVAARRLGQGDLSQRVNVKGGGELSVLATTFNSMADSLQKSEQMRRSMTADIAHELRNPLAVQRANLEALQDGVYSLTPQALEPVLEQNLLLTHLVGDLRTLALVDAGELKLERSLVDLTSLLERIVERFKPQAAQDRISIIMEGFPSEKPVQVSVDPFRIDQILSNLISNALRHTPKGGQVVLTMEMAPAQVEVIIRDSGQGIPIESLPHVFERFYRADRSRSRAEGGTGLGLAIARKLAEANGGTLSAANHPRGGAIFTLTLPLITHG